MDCPFCGGRGTFTISNRDGTRVWNCYKASCPISGSVATDMSVGAIKRRLEGESRASSIRLSPEIPTLLSDPSNHDSVIDYLKLVGSYEAYEQGWVQIRYAPAENRVLFFFHHNQGATGRALDARKPKWKVYGDTSGLFRVGTGDIAVVLEDAASACSVARLPECSGCALLGTSLSVTHKRELLLYERVVIALDKDASRKAVELKSKLDGRIDVRVALLEDDLKYMSTDAIKRILK